MIKHVIFDMDGVLIDSEPLWQLAEIDIFSTVGHDLNSEMCSQTTGMRMEDAINYWYSKKSWKNKSKETVSQEIVEKLIVLLKEQGEAMPGVIEILDILKDHKITISLCSSSSLKIIQEVVKKLDIVDYFECIYSAESAKYGKPHPEAFLTVAAKMNTEPQNCLVIEDSFNGMIAAKAAQMKLVGIPDHKYYNLSKFDFCDLKLRSLRELNFDKIKQIFE
ncbi:hexitol phosphatase HxpB [Fluviispira multicolorata]|uniref:Hexitol phosphatase HxpB n=1 Tax=Fluviispira multicolorata TaxID=2654512 RepID=A0A833JBV4_9BACT|nr:hexitol phosphatase HxpB [Fluviispira multicolorata]KAB8029173.1 hexitol phosphatase HxpB [Fluviispira multicolorata]